METGPTKSNHCARATVGLNELILRLGVIGLCLSLVGFHIFSCERCLGTYHQSMVVGVTVGHTRTRMCFVPCRELVPGTPRADTAILVHIQQAKCG